MTDLNPDLRHWQERAAKLEKERDDLRKFVDRITTEGAGEGRRKGREDGELCANSMDLDTLSRGSYLRTAQEGVRFAWWKLGFTEGVQRGVYERLDFDPDAEDGPTDTTTRGCAP